MSCVPAAPWEPRTKLSADRKVTLARERYRAKQVYFFEDELKEVKP
jgi:hypothetical protein